MKPGQKVHWYRYQRHEKVKIIEAVIKRITRVGRVEIEVQLDGKPKKRFVALENIRAV